jgi:hypothetical protein
VHGVTLYTPWSHPPPDYADALAAFDELIAEPFEFAGHRG